jgi:hypothetical protein
MPPRPSKNGGTELASSTMPILDRKKARRREIIPTDIREEVISFGKLLAECSAFAGNSRLKYSVGRLLTAQLPPQPRPPGRPGYAMVTAAVRALDEARRLYPELSQKQRWRQVYREVIPDYHSLPAIERRDAQNHLCRQVRWRLYARRRRKSGKPGIKLSVL